MKMISIKRFSISILLSIQTIYCWWCFFKAKELPYDENYGIIIQAVIISIATWIFIKIMRIKWIANIIINNSIYWSWILLGSPLTFIILIIFYKDLFGSLAM